MYEIMCGCQTGDNDYMLDRSQYNGCHVMPFTQFEGNWNGTLSCVDFVEFIMEDIPLAVADPGGGAQGAPSPPKFRTTYSYNIVFLI